MKHSNWFQNVARGLAALVAIFVAGTAMASTPESVIQFGTSKWDVTYQVVADDNSNIFTAGDTLGNLDNMSVYGGQDGFLKKYDSTGTVTQWTLAIGTAGTDEIRGLAVDRRGNAYVCGTATINGNKDMIVAKVSPSGQILWMDQSGTAAEDSAQSITVDRDGNAYVCGWTMGSMDGKRDPQIYRDAVIIKYAANGQFFKREWVLQWNTASRPLNNYAWGITNYRDMVYVTGCTVGSGSGNLFLYTFDTNGNFQWKQTMGGENTHGKGIAANANGVYVVGWTLSGFDGNKYCGGQRDAFIIKFATNGTKQWSKQMGTTGWDEATGVQLDSDGNAYMIGHTNMPIDGQQAIRAFDIFMTKFDQNGNKLSTSQFGTTGQDYGYSIHVDKADVIRVGAATEGLMGAKKFGSLDAVVTKHKAETGAFQASVTIYDQDSRQPVPNTEIVVFDADNNVVKETVTDQYGKFTVECKKAGKYFAAMYKNGYLDNSIRVVLNKGAKNDTYGYIARDGNGCGNTSNGYGWHYGWDNNGRGYKWFYGWGNGF